MKKNFFVFELFLKFYKLLYLSSLVVFDKWKKLLIFFFYVFVIVVVFNVFFLVFLW